MRALSIRGGALIFIATGCALTLGPSAVHAVELPINESIVGNARQVIVVSASRTTSTEGTLSAYERVNDEWVVVQKPIRAQLGYGGLVPGDKRRQATGTTPTGTYSVVSAFGRKADPGTALNYIRVDRNDAWTYNPKVPSTYNLFQNADRSWKSYGKYVEELWDMGMQYNYVAVLDYNLPKGQIRTGKNGVRRTNEPANTRLGGGIFLHVDNGKKTAGCISIAQPAMRNILRWLDPDQEPMITITAGL
jgi:L,D-peptidoglycan transpeptidase YkuD (ErfK/YbiS/YcfS/YnhG family)